MRKLRNQVTRDIRILDNTWIQVVHVFDQVYIGLVDDRINNIYASDVLCPVTGTSVLYYFAELFAASDYRFGI